LASGQDFHPNFADALLVHEALDALQASAKTRLWTAVKYMGA